MLKMKIGLDELLITKGKRSALDGLMKTNELSHIMGESLKSKEISPFSCRKTLGFVMATERQSAIFRRLYIVGNTPGPQSGSWQGSLL
jgi:hypothetical protein